MRNYKRPLYSHKHYEDAAFDASHVSNPDEQLIIVNYLIELFKSDSPVKFDVHRFLKACDVSVDDYNMYARQKYGRKNVITY